MSVPGEPEGTFSRLIDEVDRVVQASPPWDEPVVGKLRVFQEQALHDDDVPDASAWSAAIRFMREKIQERLRQITAEDPALYGSHSWFGWSSTSQQQRLHTAVQHEAVALFLSATSVSRTPLGALGALRLPTRPLTLPRRGRGMQAPRPQPDAEEIAVIRRNAARLLPAGASIDDDTVREGRRGGCRGVALLVG